MIILIALGWFVLCLYGLLMTGSLYAMRSLGLKVEGLGLKVEGLGLKVEGLGMRVEGLEFRGLDESVSIVIAMRNEAKHVDRLLQSILSQDYPRELVEIILVDDHSDDDTAEKVKRFLSNGVQFIQLEAGEGLGKKAAINKGILVAKHDNIVLTDADCVFNKNWLTSLVTYKKKTDAVMVVAPVMLKENQKALDIFQTLDFISLQGMTMVGANTGLLNMCNGANLMYSKSAFLQVNGFEGIDHLATGDDMLLMEKFNEAFPGRIRYCYDSDAIVETASPETLKAFMLQRIRWAGKSTVYKSSTIKATLLLVYLLNFMLCSLLVASFFKKEFFMPWLAMTCIKTILELPFMYRVAVFFKRGQLLWWFLPMQPLHHAYIVLAGFFGLIGKVEWKGRRV